MHRRCSDAGSFYWLAGSSECMFQTSYYFYSCVSALCSNYKEIMDLQTGQTRAQRLFFFVTFEMKKQVYFYSWLSALLQQRPRRDYGPADQPEEIIF